MGNNSSLSPLEEKIYKAIAASPYGIKGREIAISIGEDKKVVNSTLYRSNLLKSLVVQGSDYRWRLIGGSSAASKGEVPKFDDDLHNICSYFLDCITAESSNAVSQFLSSKFSLQYAVLNGLQINADVDKNALELLHKISTDKNKKAYMGYPIKVYSICGKNGATYKKIAPIFMFNIDYAGGRVEISESPIINMEIIKAYSDNNVEAQSVELINLETELGINSQDIDFEIEELVLRLKEIRQWDWAESLDPYNIPHAEDISGLENGIYNRPIIIEAEKSKYTQGLESELMVLSNMPESGYRNTALYSWVKGLTQKSSVEDTKPLLEVLPLNSEQSQAVETALKSDLTIVTGPPGTGKSQVVTDLLINIAWNGKSALFSSKNNKAVDVVDERVNGLCQNPVLLRIGSNQYATRLAEIIEGMLSSTKNLSDENDFDFYYKAYSQKLEALKNLKNEKNSVVERRNQLDSIESKYLAIKNVLARYSGKISTIECEKLLSLKKGLEDKWKSSQKDNNDFITRLFWFFFKDEKLKAYSEALDNYNKNAKKYGFDIGEQNISISELNKLDSSINELLGAVRVEDNYKRGLCDIRNVRSLEDIDKAITDNKHGQADIAYKLWNSWLKSKAVTFSAIEREEMLSFVTAMKLTRDIDLSQNEGLRKQYNKMVKLMTSHLQCWAVTSLSAKSRIPFQAGLFDYVIIDESSQCDIASILPLLFRAKKAVIIGDPKQLSHISQITRQKDLGLLQKYEVPQLWSYSQNSLYTLAAGKVNPDDIVMLKDHFRSCADIIEFSNKYFYDGSLRTATRYNGLKTPNGENPGIRWLDVKGETVRPPRGSAYNDEEVTTVVAELKRLVEIGYKGTIGVTTPFRAQAEKIKNYLENNEQGIYQELINNHEFIVDTVHKFQGDERDVMIFTTVVSDNAPQSALGFLSSTGNLFNVAITRARAVLVIVGNRAFCSDCTVDYLKKFVEYCNKLSQGKAVTVESGAVYDAGREYPQVNNPEQVSEWEKMLYQALYDAGIKTVPQYPVEKYCLDLVIMLENGRKLDIEVDGEMYHRSWNGELCYRDQLRNQRMFELGWDVKRFWVYQIRDDMDWCVEQIKNWVKSAK